MSDLELFTILVEYLSEYNKHFDTCFVDAYNYAEFVAKLNIRDSEDGFDAYVTTDGALCFELSVFESRTDDYELLKEKLTEHFEAILFA